MVLLSVIYILNAIINLILASKYFNNSNLTALYYHTDGQPIIYEDAENNNYNELIIHLMYVNHVVLRLDLVKERKLFSSNYMERIVNETGSYIRSPDQMKTNCYYNGKIFNETESQAIMSICFGLSGSFTLSGRSYEIESDPSGSHKLEKVFLRYVKPDKTRHYCPVHGNYTNENTFSSKRFKRQNKGIYHYVEAHAFVIQVYVVNDYKQYKQMGSDVAKTIEKAKVISRISNAFFQVVDTYIVLVGIEVHTSQKIVYDPKKNSVYNHHIMSEYIRKNVITQPNFPEYDVITMMLVEMFPPNWSVGAALIGTMCQTTRAFIYSSTENEIDISIAGIMVHEICHVLNIQHDQKYKCTDCKFKLCIMNAFSSGETNLGFSSCSFEKLKKYLPTYPCLRNNFVYKGYDATCGNGILDTNEQCDCLPGNKVCGAKCCDKCKFTSGSQCAFGLCCDIKSCKLKAANSVCRPKKGDCDLDDKCDGKSAICLDKRMQDGVMCKGKNFCLDGICVVNAKICEVIWGSGTKESSKECYNLNMEGNPGGHCLIKNTIVTKCGPADVLCGLVQCNVDVGPFQSGRKKDQVGLDLINGKPDPKKKGHYCASGVVIVGYNRDVGYSPDGAKCGANRMCFYNKCRHRTFFLFNEHKKHKEATSSSQPFQAYDLMFATPHLILSAYLIAI